MNNSGHVQIKLLSILYLIVLVGLLVGVLVLFSTCVEVESCTERCYRMKINTTLSCEAICLH